MPFDLSPADMNLPQDPAQVTAPTAPATVVAPQTGAPATAVEMYLAAKAYREVLTEQRESLRETRRSVANALREDQRTAPDLEGLQKRLTVLDEQMVELEKQIGVANAREAQAAAIPGAIPPEVPDPPRPPDVEDIVAIGALLSFALMFPVVIAYSRRIWRRSAKMTVTLPPDVAHRMQAMEEAIESVAVEVERIGEGQRFVTQALADQPRFVGAGAAEPVMVRAREAAHAERPL